MEIDGSQGDLPAESGIGPAVQSKGDLGNPIEIEQQTSLSRKRKLGDEEYLGIDPHQPALKVLHVEERHGDHSRDHHQSDLMSSAQLVGDDSGAIEFKESFMNPHQTHLDALLVVEDRSDDYNNDSLSALRAYTGADESPSPEEDEFPNVSFGNALEPGLEGLHHSQELPSAADVDNVLSASPPPLTDLRALDVHVEKRADDDGSEIRLIVDPQSGMEPSNVVEISPEDFQLELKAPHVLETRLEEETQLLVRDAKFELEASHVLENRVVDETQLRISDPQSELEELCGQDQTVMHLDDPQPQLEALHVKEIDSPPHLEPLFVEEECDPRPQLEPLLVEESDPQPELQALHVEESEGQPEFEALHVEESEGQAEFEALHVMERDPQPELEEALPVKESGAVDETQLRLDEPHSELGPPNAVESAVQDEAIVVITDPVLKFGALNAVESAVDHGAIGSISDPQTELGALNALKSAVDHEAIESISDPQRELGALNTMESAVDNEAIGSISKPLTELGALDNEAIGSISEPQTEFGALDAVESTVDTEAIGSISDPRTELGALNAMESAVDTEATGSISEPQTELGTLNVLETAAEDEAIPIIIDPQTELEVLVEDGGENDTKVYIKAPLSEMAVLPVLENLEESETKVSVHDPQPESEAMQVVQSSAGQGQGEAGQVQLESDPSEELDLRSMELVEDSGEDESQSAAKKRKLVLLAAVAAFFSTLAGALGSIGELVGQLEKTAMAGVSLDRDGHLERTVMAAMTSTSSSSSPPSPLSESTALRLHSAMARSSSSLHNNIIVSMFLLMQQHRKRSQKRPRELTGPWYIKPRSAQAFESFLDFSPQGDPEKFRELFRISPGLFFHICQMVRDEMLSDTPRSLRVLPNRVLTVERQVAIAIRRLATGNQFLGIADSIGVSKSTAVKVTWKFIVAFIKKARAQHLQWPNSEQMQRIKDGFRTQWGFPNCCGVVDGTHFTVEFPKGEDVSQYYDHQNHVSISMQAIVGHDQRFLDVVVGWPGSIQEYQLLQNTNFFRTVANTKERLNGDAYVTQDGSSLREYILGDAGYPLYDWLMVPYPTGLSAAKDEWNSRHAVAKQCVEDALARLKGTWKILSRILWKPRKERIGKMVFACCLLHNMIIERQDGLNPDVYAGVNPHPGGYTGVSIPTEEVFEGGPEAREVLFREVMGGGIV